MLTASLEDLRTGVVHTEELLFDDVCYTISVLGRPDCRQIRWTCDRCDSITLQNSPGTTIEAALGFAQIKVKTHHLITHYKQLGIVNVLVKGSRSSDV